MAWPAGTRLGPYEILAPLGAGGMGEVYRARDAKLNRDVAIKVLPSPLAEDAEALARFEREARAVAALSHPNILAIFDFQREGAVAYAVTELLEGETLHSRLTTGALPAHKTIEYGVQIAQGLAAAHERGIVHRDLKPENVFVTADGRVKILDFGLARQDRPGAGSENTRSPTMTRHTEPGTVMGTVGYMSPEQVRGRAADALSDIFSFGVVLYEMGAGRRAFQRETAAETMTAILKEEPPPIADSGANVPPGFERIVAHCLEKSPQERFQSARDIAFALQELSGQSTPRAGAAALAQKRHVPGGLVLATLGIAALVAAYLAGGRNDHTQPPAFHRLTFRRGIVHAARFAADERTILYSAAWQGGPSQVYSTRVDGIESRPLDLQGATLLALSQADEIAVARNARVDRSAYWSVMQGTLASAPLSGGAPRDLLQDIAFADFSPDGRTLAIVRGRADKRALESPPGRILYETAGWISEPRLSPSGEGIAFLDHLHATTPGGDVCLIDSGGKKRTLSSGFLRAQGLAWSPNGREVWFTASREGSARALYGVSLSGKERLIYRMPGALTLHDVSRSGRVLLAREEIRRESRARAPGDAQEKDVSWLDYSNLINISSDGTTIVFVEMGDGGGPGSTTYVRRLDGSPATLVVAGANTLDLSLDGQWLLSMKDSDSAHPELRLVPTGPGEPKVLKTVPMEYDYGFLSPDGKKVFTTARTAGQGARTYVQDVGGGPPRPVASEGLATSLLDTSGTDGDSIVVRNGAGDALLWSLSAERGRPIPGFDSHGEMAIGFGQRGALYVSPVGGLPRPVFRLDTTTGVRQRVLDLLPADPTGVSEIDIAALTPDASAYAYSYIRRSCDLYVVDGLK